MKKVSVFAGLLFISIASWATNYYVANNGDNSNKGTSPKSPWKSIEKLNQTIFLAGDSILFKADNSFTGKLVVKNSGSKESPIVISSYGSGEKPVITGAVEIKEWDNKSEKVYSSDMNQKVFSLFKGNERLTLARWPNQGYFKIDEGDKLSLTDNRFKGVDFSLAGASARIKSVDWQSETMEVKENKGDKIYFTEKMIYSSKKDYGYFLDNKFEFMDTINEWYYDKDKKRLFLLYHQKPTNIQANVIDTGIVIEENVHNVVIHGLQVEKFNTACIYAKGFSNNVVIDNCDVGNSMVFGIYLDKGTKHFTIANSTFSDIPGRGICTMESSDLVVEGNTLKRIGLLPGYGFNGVNNEVAIAILKSETIYFISASTIQYLKDQKATPKVLETAIKIEGLPFSGQRWLKMELEKFIPEEKEWIEKLVKRVGEELSTQQLESTNNVVRGNYIDSIGYIGIRLDGSYSLAEKNIVKNTILHMNDGGAIYCWGQHYDYTHNNTIRQNIVINPEGSKEATPNNRLFGIGIYVDNRCRNITVEDNIFLEAKAGILINDDSFDNIIQNNTTYDNLYGIMFSEFYKPGSLKGCVTENNIMFSKQRHQRCLFNETRLSEELNASTFNNNYYGSPYYTYPILELTYKDEVRRYHEYTLDSWQREKNEDLDSRIFAPEDPEDRGNESFILINDSYEDKVFTINKDRKSYDIHGNLLGEEVTLKPFTSLIVIME